MSKARKEPNSKTKNQCNDSNESTFPEDSSYFDESPNRNIKGSLHHVKQVNQIYKKKIKKFGNLNKTNNRQIRNESYVDPTIPSFDLIS